MVRPAPADDAALRAAAGAAAGQARRRFAMGASSNARAAGREPRLPPARPSGGRTASRGDRPVPPNAPDRPSAARCRAAAARALHLSASLTTMARSKKPAPPPPPLGELEAEVMEHVWERGESSVRAAMEALNARAAEPRAYTTYMTVLARLHAKGMLERRREGKSDH